MLGRCPKCKQQLDLSGFAAGTTVACVCGTKLKIPSTTTPKLEPNPIAATNAPLQNPALDGPLSAVDPALLAPPPGPYPGAPQPAPGTHPGVAGTPVQGSSNRKTASSKSEKEQLDLVNRGVQLVFWGMAISACCLVLIWIPGGIAIWALISTASILVNIITIAGYAFSLNAPPASDAKKFVLIALLLHVSAGLILPVFNMLNQLFSETPLEWIVTGAGMIATMLPSFSSLCYLLFIKTLANYTGQKDIEKQAGELLWLMLWISVVSFASSLFLFVMPVSFISLGIMTIFSLVLMVASLVALFRCLTFFQTLKFRKPISRGASHTAATWGAAR